MLDPGLKRAKRTHASGFYSLGISEWLESSSKGVSNRMGC